MSGLNRATLIGNVGAAPEIRSTNNGNRIASFSVATSERWTDKQSGEKKERTEWHRIMVFNDNLVEIIQKYVSKGSKLCVEGALRTRKYTDNAGVERYTTEIVLQNFGGQLILLGDSGSNRPPPADEGSYGERSYSTRHNNPTGRPASGRGSDLDDEIPF